MFRFRQLLKANAELLKNNEDLKKIMERVQHIDEKVSYKGYRPLRWFICISTLTLYGYKDTISNLISNKAKNLTQETIEDEKVKRKAQEMLNQLLTSEETKQALYNTFQNLFDDPKSQESLSVFLKDSATKTMEDKNLKKTASSYCWDIIKGSVWRS